MYTKERDASQPLALEQLRTNLASVLSISASGIVDHDFLSHPGLYSVRPLTLGKCSIKNGATVPFATLEERATFTECAVLLCV